MATQKKKKKKREKNLSVWLVGWWSGKGGRENHKDWEGTQRLHCKEVLKALHTLVSIGLWPLDFIALLASF